MTARLGALLIVLAVAVAGAMWALSSLAEVTGAIQ